MDLEKLVMDGVDLEIYDNLEISFNDGAGQLKSASGKQVQFGETLQKALSMPFTVSEKKSTSMEALANFWIVLISLALALSFVLSFFHGSLVTTWMLINTLQLIAHLPLLTTTLPANAHYFLLNLLSVVRMNIDHLGATLDDFDTVRKEFEIQSDPKNQFLSNLLDNGYHVSFLRNTLFLSTLIVLIAFVWFWMAVLEKSFCKRRTLG